MGRAKATSRIGETIRTLRMARGFAQGELAARAGISPALLSLWESGRREPSLSRLRRVAHELDSPAALLFAVALVDAAPRSSRAAQDLVDDLVAAARARILAGQVEAVLSAEPENRRRRTARNGTKGTK